MNREAFYSILQKEQEFDYENYLNTEQLLSCQKDFGALCNKDELQFQIVHQVEELWLKLIVYTLLDIDEYMEKGHTNKVITLFQRVHGCQRLMIEQLTLLETMSPKDYQGVREQLGNGSGRESPGFRAITRMPNHLWNTFKTIYLDGKNLTIEKIYSTEYQHCDSYMVAECLAEFDELFQKFCYHHMQLIYRSIGFESKSLKGRSVEMLNQRVRSKFFPEIWEIRTKMTDEWGVEYGVVRDSIVPA